MSTINKVYKDFRINPLPYVVQVVGLLVVLLNLFIVSKIAPIAQDLAVITTRVEANEKTSETFIVRKEVELQLKEINRRLTGIEGKIDTYFITSP